MSVTFFPNDIEDPSRYCRKWDNHVLLGSGGQLLCHTGEKRFEWILIFSKWNNPFKSAVSVHELKWGWGRLCGRGGGGVIPGLLNVWRGTTNCLSWSLHTQILGCLISTKTKVGLVTEDDHLAYHDQSHSMTVWDDTIAVFGDGWLGVKGRCDNILLMMS